MLVLFCVFECLWRKADSNESKISIFPFMIHRLKKVEHELHKLKKIVECLKVESPKVEKVATDAQIKKSRTRIAQIITNLKICESAVKTLFLLFFLYAFCGKKNLRPLRKTLRPLRLRKKDENICRKS